MCFFIIPYFMRKRREKKAAEAHARDERAPQPVSEERMAQLSPPSQQNMGYQQNTEGNIPTVAGPELR